MRFLSLFSGIEAASEAWAPLGWECVGVAEIDPFACAVLKHRHPRVPNLGDITKVTEMQVAALGHIDLVVFGSPCQDLSVAGKQKGLSGERSGLFFPAIDIISWCRIWCGTRFALWENVPGAFSSNSGRDFAAVVDALAGLAGTSVPPKGWGTEGCAVGAEAMVEWSTLDAQWFGVAQRRRRVFALADFGDWTRRQPILLEPQGLRGDSAPRREAREVAPTIPARSTAGGGLGTDFDCDGGTICVATGQAGAEICAEMAPTLNCNHEAPYVAHTLRGEGFDASENGTGRGTPLVPVCVTIHGTAPAVQKVASYDELAQCLRARTPGNIDNSSTTVVQQPVAYGIRTANTSSNGWGVQEECTHTLDCAQGVAVAQPVVYAIQAGALRVNPASGPAGIGVQADHAYTLEARAEVQAVAVAVALRGREGGATAELGDEVQNCLRASSGGGDKPHVRTDMQVRRLTPVECERLQGFPTVSEKITIQAYLDHQNQSVRVALKCLRWQNNALSAEESALTQPAKTAAVPSSTSPARLAPLAALHVRMHSVDELLEVRSAGRLIWSASGAGQSRKSLPPTLTENSVQELARLLREVARTITDGKAESPPSIRLSFPASSGAINAEKSGREMEESASDAMSDQHRATFTTSDLGLITTFSDSTAETLSCFALHAIAGCIPSTTLPETFSIEMTVETPYTAIPWRGKPASECPDGPRYKALGNSMAVPVMRWIGQRIDLAMLFQG